MIAHHVRQRHLGHHCTHQLRVGGEADSGQQAAVGTTAHAQLFARAVATCNKVAQHGLMILIDPHPLSLDHRGVPGRPEFATATQVGLHEVTAALEPGQTTNRRVLRDQRDLETAVGVHEGWGWVRSGCVGACLRACASTCTSARLRAKAAGDAIRNARAIGRGRPVLACLHPLTVEERRSTPHFRERAADLPVPESCRLCCRGRHQPNLIIAFRGRINHAHSGLCR